MRYKVFIRKQGQAYRDTWLWLPKEKVSVEVLKHSLELEVFSNGNFQRVLQLWKEEPHHLLVPREFIRAEELDYPVTDLSPTFERVDFESAVELDAPYPNKTTQKDAYDDIIKSRGGILNLACGAGKTVIMCHAMAHWQQPVLVINDKEHILHQWKEALEKFLKFEGGIGWVQGKPDKWDWKRPVTLAMLKSLSKYSDSLPDGMTSWFGRIIWDEIHHLSAPTFSPTAPLFPGLRYGATATANRPDGTELLYTSHVGPIIHSNLEQEVIPKVVFKRSHTEIDFANREVRNRCYSRNGEVHHRKMAAHVGTLPEEVKLCSEVIQRGVENGRRILALSLSRDQVIEMHKRFPGSGLVIGGNPKKPEDRLKVIRDHKLLFATTDLAQEALDEKRLDSLVLLTEFSSENILQQAVGRIQRPDPSRKNPSKVVVIFHTRIPPMRAMGANLMKHFRRWGFKLEMAN